MTTDLKLARLYRDACADDRQLLANIDVSDLIDLANGRLAGERRARMVDALATSPSLARAYRMAKASGDWSAMVASELAGEKATGHNVRIQPIRRARPVGHMRRRRFAMAAAISAMAIGAVFVTQRLESPSIQADNTYASTSDAAGGNDSIMLTSFDASRDGNVNADIIFTSRMPADNDRIFAFGKGS
jgi:hypothetical protein